MARIFTVDIPGIGARMAPIKGFGPFVQRCQRHYFLGGERLMNKGDLVDKIAAGCEARNGRNPQTGATIKIAARKVARFTPGADLKKAINKK